MHWNSLADFIAMGGRGAYVWGAYGVAACLIAAELWQLSRHRRAVLRALQACSERPRA